MFRMSEKRPCIVRRTMSMRKFMYVVYYTIYGPALQVEVLNGKCATALLYRDKLLKKTQICS